MRCDGLHADGEALKQRIALEQARVGELEGLLAIARADQVGRLDSCWVGVCACWVQGDELGSALLLPDVPLALAAVSTLGMGQDKGQPAAANTIHPTVSCMPACWLAPPPPRLQFKRDAVAAESGADRQVASLQEQRRLLEEQAATLQRQVDGLVQVGLCWSCAVLCWAGPGWAGRGPRRAGLGARHQCTGRTAS